MRALSLLLPLQLLAAFSPFSQRTALQTEHDQLTQQLAPLPERPLIEPCPAVGYHSRWSRSESTPLEITLDLGQSFPLDAVVIVPAAPAALWAYGFPPRFKVEAFSTLPAAAPHLLLDQTASDQPQPTGPLFLHAHGQRARYLRFTATKLFRQPNWTDGFMFCLGEIYAFSEGRNVALGSTVGTPSTQFTRAFPDWSPENLVDGASALGLPVEKDLQPTDKINSGWHSSFSHNPETPKWVQIDLGKEYVLDEIRAIPASPITFSNRPGFGFPERFRIELSSTADFETPVLVVDATHRDHPNPGNQLLCWSLGGRKGRFVRFTATKMQRVSNDYAFALAELEVYAGNQNVALGRAVLSPDPTPHPSFQPQYLVDGRSGSGRLLPLQTWLEGIAHRARIEQQLELIDHKIQSVIEAERRFWLTAGWCTLGVIVCGLSLWTAQSMARRRREMQSLRQQIARDLHDEIGSSLGTIALMSELGARDHDVSSLQRIRELASEAANSMRGIVWMIRDGTPPPLDQLEKTLRTYCSQALHGVPHRFTSSGSPPPGRQSLDFYRNLFLVLKEALHNAIRHAQASHITITIAWNPARFSLQIQDNGSGFDPSLSYHGSGLANMRQRAQAMNAVLQIDSQPLSGTTVTLEAPLI